MKITKNRILLNNVETTDDLFLFLQKNCIKDLKAKTKELDKILEFALDNFQQLNITLLNRYFRENYFKIKGKCSKEYWLIRGWAEIDANKEISDLQKNNSPLSETYWLKRGYDVTVAKEKIKLEQSARGKKLSFKLKNDTNFKREFSPCNKEHWLKRGLSEQEAELKALQNRDKKFKNSLESYVSLYGYEKGLEKWEYFKKQSSYSKDKLVQKMGKLDGEQKYQDIINSLGTTLNKFIKRYGVDDGKKKYDEFCKKIEFKGNIDWYIDKYGIEEGKLRYNLKCKNVSFSRTIKGLILKYGLEEGTERYKQWQKKLHIQKRTASKRSLIYFKKLYQKLRRQGIQRDDIYFGIKGSSEWYLSDGVKFYLYDFTIRSKKIIIEFNGEHVHPNPEWKVNDIKRWRSWRHPWNKKSAEVVFQMDMEKKLFAESKGYKVVVLWYNCNFEDNWKIIQKEVIDCA